MKRKEPPHNHAAIATHYAESLINIEGKSIGKIKGELEKNRQAGSKDSAYRME